MPGDGESVPPRVWRGTLWLSLGRIWGAACGAALLLFLARNLPRAEFGRFTFYLAVFALLDGLADFGTGQVAVQRSAHDARALPAVLRAVRRIRGATAGLGWTLVALGAWTLGEPGPGWVALAALYTFTRLPEASAVVFQNRIAWGVPVLVRAASALLRLVLAWALVRGGVQSAAPLLLAHAVAASLANLLLHLTARPLLRETAGDGTTPVARGVLTAALPLGLAGLLQQAYLHVDNFFVRGLRGEEELGAYNAAVRLASFTILVGTYATTSALPWFARRHRAGDLAGATATLSRPLLVLAGLGLGALLPWSAELLRVLFGAGFEAAGPSLRWLLVAAFLVYAGAGLLTGLVATGATRRVLAVVAVALLVNVTGNALLVGRMGIRGAALATAATELAVVLGSFAALAGLGAAPRPRPLGWLAGALAFGGAAAFSAALRSLA